ncbi:MAG: aspartate kinase [bacterium]|nr:aspartate kinase [bacterium]
MALIVQKYGGKSVATPELLKEVAARIIKTKRAGNQVVVVVSAMGNTTDNLIEKAMQVNPEPEVRELDMLLACGEQEAVALLAMAISAQGEPAVGFTGPQAGIHTDGKFGKAKITRIYPNRVQSALEQGKIPVIAGFQGIAGESDIATLGRGGSDLTAVAIAASIKADVCEKYTDEEGVYTANPKLVKDARKLEVISYDEMIELSSLGAKVLQARSVLFAKKHNVPIRVRSSMSDDPGTLITKEVKGMEQAVVSYVIPSKNEAKVTIVGVPDKPGIAALVFGKLAEKEISVDMIIQNVSEAGKTDITYTVAKSDYKEAIKVSESLKKEIGAREVKGDDKIGKISVVGVGMRSAPGIAATMFSALAEKGINIEMISTSEIRISCVIDEKHLDTAVKVLHEKFELGKRQPGA